MDLREAVALVTGGKPAREAAAKYRSDVAFVPTVRYFAWHCTQMRKCDMPRHEEQATLDYGADELFGVVVGT